MLAVAPGTVTRNGRAPYAGLASFPVNSVVPTSGAELLKFDTTGVVLLVLVGTIVTHLAVGASHGNDYAGACFRHLRHLHFQRDGALSKLRSYTLSWVLGSVNIGLPWTERRALKQGVPCTP
jgi:hypothetical protein